jgi:hypothetical protein
MSVGFIHQIKIGQGAMPVEVVYTATDRINGTRVDGGAIEFSLDESGSFLTINCLGSKVKHVVPITNISHLKYDSVQE